MVGHTQTTWHAQTLVVIPARLNARRFPNKPLATLLGQPLIRHVVRLALNAWSDDDDVDILVATDHPSIAHAVDDLVAVVLFDQPFRCGSARVALAARTRPQPAHWVFNLQGDEPCLPVDVLRQCLTHRRHSTAPLTTPCVPMSGQQGWHDPDVVKVVANAHGHALYFSRAPIPSDAHPPWWRHLGVYGFTFDSLMRFATLPPSPLETRESLEQLRALEQGWHIDLLVLDDHTDAPWPSINRPHDLDDAIHALQRHPHPIHQGDLS